MNTYGTALLMVAMGTPPGGPAQGQGSPMLMLGYMLIIFALFYFMLIRPQMRKEKERKKLIESVKTGDRILFGGGILGLVSNVKDKTLVVKIADNVKVEIVRSAVMAVVPRDQEPAEPNGSA